jgi:hypothetical protein
MSVRAFPGGAILLGLFALGVAWNAARDDNDVPEELPRAPPGCPGLRDPPQPPFPPALRLGAEGVEWEPLEQDFWSAHEIFRIQHPFPPLHQLVVAVDLEERILRLTNDRPVQRPNAALRCFNAITRRERVTIDQRNAEAYLSLFLELHAGNPGWFLPDRATAEEAASIPWGSRLEQRLQHSLGEQSRHPVTVMRWRDDFHGTGYGWDPQRGVVHAYEIEVSRDEIVGFERRVLGVQPRNLLLGGGTCFGVAESRLVLTAHHVVRDAFLVVVRFLGGPEIEAEVAATWPGGDLALLRLREPGPPIPSLPLEGPAEPGTPVFTLALPPDVPPDEEPWIAEGEILRLVPAYELLISVPARAGFSGSPIVSHTGAVLGVLLRHGGSRDGSQQLTLAVRAQEALRLLPRPSPLVPAASLEEAIWRAREALCSVTVERRSPRRTWPSASK